MNTIDIVIGIILIFGTVNGFMKGLFVEVTTLVGLVLGVYGAIHFSYFLGDFLKDSVSWDESMIQVVSFAGTFLDHIDRSGFVRKSNDKNCRNDCTWIFQ